MIKKIYGLRTKAINQLRKKLMVALPEIVYVGAFSCIGGPDDIVCVESNAIVAEDKLRLVAEYRHPKENIVFEDWQGEKKDYKEMIFFETWGKDRHETAGFIKRMDHAEFIAAILVPFDLHLLLVGHAQSEKIHIDDTEIDLGEFLWPRSRSGIQ